MAADNDNYWNQSNIKGFFFDDTSDISLSPYGIPLSGASTLSQQLRDSIKLDSAPNESFSAAAVPSKRKEKFPLHQLISEKSLNAILDADNFEIVTTKSTLKPEEEVRLLRRKLQAKWDEPDINTTLKDILFGRPYSLEMYKSIEGKQALLDASIAFGDGDAILEVVRFLSRTLKKSLFYQMMFESPIGVKHYTNFLSTRMQSQELTDLLELLGQNEEAAMYQFKLACQNPQRNLKKIHSIGMKYFSDSKDKVFIDNFIRLIEWQMKHTPEIVGASVKATLETILRGQKTPADMAAKDTLALELVREQGTSYTMYQLAAMVARAELAQWTSIFELLTTTGWLGSKKLKTDIPVEEILAQLHEQKAPNSVLQDYFTFISDGAKKIELGKKLKCHKVVIDELANQKDRAAILSYKDTLHPQSEEFFHAENVLRLYTIKWKN